MEQLIQGLKKLNLTEKEAKLYLTLLELGPSTPYRIAKKSQMKRPTAYVIAEELAEKGLIVRVTGEKQCTYIARSPESYVEEVEQRVKEARDILPELIAIQKKTSDKPNILYFEGTEGVRQAMMYKLNELHDTEIVSFSADPDLTAKENYETSFAFNEYRMAHNIRVRSFLTETESLKPFEKYIKDTTPPPKFIPKEMYSSNASFEFYQNFVKIIFFDTSVAVIIESSAVSKAMRQIFEMLWSRVGDEYSESEVIK